MSNGVLTPAAAPDDHVLGPSHAPVMLVEYGDYECPHCGRAHVVLQTVLSGLGDQVRFFFRNFPLAEIHPHAQAAAEAAESVAAHDVLRERAAFQWGLERSDRVCRGSARGSARGSPRGAVTPPPLLVHSSSEPRSTRLVRLC